MCRKLIVLALVLGLASISFADVLIGNFEDHMSDNWVGTRDAVIGSVVHDVPLWIPLNHGVTLGDMALGVKTNWNYWLLQWPAPSILDLFEVTAVKMDVTMIAKEWIGGDDWTKVDKMSVNSDIVQPGSPNDPKDGWMEYIPTAIDRITGLPTSLDWGSWSADAAKTYTWDMSEDPYNTKGATYLQFNFALQGGDEGCFHIDNVWLIGGLVGDLTGGGVVMDVCIPEPMTIAMLGLGGLALLRRKRA